MEQLTEETSDLKQKLSETEKDKENARMKAKSLSDEITGFKESFQIAIMATLLGVLLSIPFAVMAARNIAPMPIYIIGRAVIIISRSFHPVIVAIIFVKAVGFGPFAGVLTLIVYSIGFVAKMLAERIEEIDFGQVEGFDSAMRRLLASWRAKNAALIQEKIEAAAYVFTSRLTRGFLTAVDWLRPNDGMVRQFFQTRDEAFAWLRDRRAA